MTKPSPLEGLVERLLGDLPVITAAPGNVPDLMRIAQERKEAATALTTLHSQLERVTEALGTISSQAICYGMRADETELRDWLKHISETAEEALAAIKEGGL